MERNDDMFYEDDQVNVENENENVEEIDVSDAFDEHKDELNDVQYFEQLLDTLQGLAPQLEDACSGFFIKKSDVLGIAKNIGVIVAQMEGNLPSAIQYGLNMYNQRNRLLNNAQDTALRQVSESELKAKKVLDKAKADAEQMIREADGRARAMLEDAAKRADYMVSDEEVVRRANEEAKTLVNDARVESREILLKARHDAYNIVTRAENAVDDAHKQLRRLSMSIDRDVE